MAKIPKNRPDSEMVGKVPETASFEHLSDGLAQPPAARPAGPEPVKSSFATFLTPQLQDDLGKALLTLKVNLYKQGIVDYAVKVSCETDHIVLRAVPAKKPPVRRD